MEKDQAKRSSKMYLIYLFVALLAFGSIVALGMLDPETLRKLIIYIDRFGITEEGRKEAVRYDTIMSLTIRYEKRQALVNHKIFLGATSEMVKLALGDPMIVSDKPPVISWVYRLPNDDRPTVLEFENNELVRAYKSSLADIPTP